MYENKESCRSTHRCLRRDIANSTRRRRVCYDNNNNNMMYIYDNTDTTIRTRAHFAEIDCRVPLQLPSRDDGVSSVIYIAINIRLLAQGL